MLGVTPEAFDAVVLSIVAHKQRADPDMLVVWLRRKSQLAEVAGEAVDPRQRAHAP